MSCCSYCRITGKSRNQPKASYPPLIPMPKPDVDELRRKYCRITAGKMEKHKYLPPIDPEAKNAPKAKRSRKMTPHKYAPVVEPKGPPREGCKITKHEDPDYSPLYSLIAAEYIKDLSESQLRSLQCSITHHHHFTPNYRYVYPIVDDKSKKILKKMKPEKEQNTILPVLPGYNYVYPVFDEECGVILSSELEETLRSGEVENIMLAKDRSEMIIETLEGTTVTLQTKELTSEEIHEEIAEENLMPGFGGGKNFVLAEENGDDEEDSLCDDSETGTKPKPKLSKLKRHYTLDLSDVQRSPPIDGPISEERKCSLPDATKLEKSKKKPKLEAFIATEEESSGPAYLSFMERALQLQKAQMGGALTFLGGPDWDEIRAAQEGFDFGFFEGDQSEETVSNLPDNDNSQVSLPPSQHCTPAISSSQVVIRCKPNQVAIPLLDDAILEEAEKMESITSEGIQASEKGPSPFPLMRSKKSSLHLNMDIQKLPFQASASISSEPVDIDEGVDFCSACLTDIDDDDVIASLMPDDFTCLDILNVNHLGMENLCNFENGIQSFESILQPGFIAMAGEVDSELQQKKKKLKVANTSQNSEHQKEENRHLVNGEITENDVLSDSKRKKSWQLSNEHSNKQLQAFISMEEAKEAHSSDVGHLSEVDKTGLTPMQSNESAWRQEAKLVADFLQGGEVSILESFDESVRTKLLNGKHHIEEILRSEITKFTDFVNVVDELSLDKKQETVVKAAICDILKAQGRFEESAALEKTSDYLSKTRNSISKSNLKEVIVGQIQTNDGLCQVTMQQIKMKDGQRVLAMGEVKTKEGSKMVALGQIHTKNGPRTVALGQIQTSDGPKMVALGQIRSNEGSKLVALGQIESGDGMKLVAMEHIETKEGTKMVAIQQIYSEDLDSSVDLCDVPKMISVHTKEGPRLANVGQIQTKQGTKTVALGKIYTKNGAKTVALGQIWTEQGAKTVAMGQINTSDGLKTLALGQIQTSDGPRMVALGQIQTPQGPKLVALAEIQTDEGPKMMAIGNIQTPDGPKLIALGQIQTKEGTKMVAIREIKPTELPHMIDSNPDQDAQSIPSIPLPEMSHTALFKSEISISQKQSQNSASNAEHKVVFVFSQKDGNQEVVLSNSEMLFLEQQTKGNFNLTNENLQHLIEEGMIQSQGNDLFLTEKGIKIQQYLIQNNQNVLGNEQGMANTTTSQEVRDGVTEVIVMNQDGSILKKRKISSHSLNCTNQLIVTDDSGKQLLVQCIEGTVVANHSETGALNSIIDKNGKEFSIPLGETVILNQRNETGEIEQIVLSNINGKLVHQPHCRITNQASSQQSKMIAVDGKHILVQQQEGQIITKPDKNGIQQTCVLDKDGKEISLTNGQAMIIEQVNEQGKREKVLVVNQGGKIISQKQNGSVETITEEQQKVVVQQKGQNLLVAQCEAQIIKKTDKKSKTTEISIIGQDGKEICIPIGQSLVIKQVNEKGEMEHIYVKNENGKIIQEKNCSINDPPDTSSQHAVITSKAGQEILVQKCEGKIISSKNKAGKITNISIVGQDGKEITVPLGKGIVVTQRDEEGQIQEVYIVNKNGKLTLQENCAIKPLVDTSESNAIGNWQYVDSDTIPPLQKQQQTVAVQKEGETVLVKQYEGQVVQKIDNKKNTVELSIIGKDGQELCISIGQSIVVNQINDKGEMEQILVKNENGKLIQDKNGAILDIPDVSSQSVVVTNQDGKELLVQKCEGKIISTTDKSGTTTNLSIIGEDGKEVSIPPGKGIVVSQTDDRGKVHEVYVFNEAGKLIQSKNCSIKELSSYETLIDNSQNLEMAETKCVDLNSIPEAAPKQPQQVVIQEKGQSILVQQCEGQIVKKTDGKGKTIEISLTGKDGKEISIPEGQGMVISQINEKGETEQIFVKRENGKLIQEKNCVVSELPNSPSQHAVAVNEEGREILIEKTEGKIINKTNKRGKVIQTALVGKDGKEIVIPEGKGILLNQTDENGEVQEIYIVNENGKLKQQKNCIIKSLPPVIAQQPQITNVDEKELSVLLYEGQIINRINSDTQAQELIVLGKDGKEIIIPAGQRVVVNQVNSNGQQEFISIVNDNGNLFQETLSVTSDNNHAKNQAVITDNESKQTKIVPQTEGKIIQKLSRKGSIVEFYVIGNDGLEIPIPEGQGVVVKQINNLGKEQLVYVFNNNGKLVQKNEMVAINHLEPVNQQNKIVSQSGKNLIIQSCEGKLIHKYGESGEILETKVLGKDGKEVPIAIGQGVIVNHVNDRGQVEQVYIVNQDGKETIIPIQGKDNKRSTRMENINHPQQQLIIKQNGKPAVIQGTVIERVNLKGQKELMFVVNQDGRQIVLSEHQVIGIVQQATNSCSAKLVDTDSLNVIKLKDSSEIIKRNPIVIMKAFAELDIKLPVNGEIDTAVINKEKNGNVIRPQLVLGQFMQTEEGIEFLFGRVVQTDDGFRFEVLPTEIAALPEKCVTALQTLDVGSGKKLVIAKLNMEIIAHGKNGIIQGSPSDNKAAKIEDSVNGEVAEPGNDVNSMEESQIIDTGAIPKRRKSAQNETQPKRKKQEKNESDYDHNILHENSNILHAVIPMESFILTENAINMISGVVLEAAARGEIRVEELEKLVNEEIVNLLSQESRYQIRRSRRLDFLQDVDEYIAERERLFEDENALLLATEPGWLSRKDAPWKISTVPCHSLSGILKRVEINIIKELDEMVVEFDLPILRRRQKIFRGIRLPPPPDPNNLVFDLYVAIADYTPDNTDTEAVPLAEGQIVEVLDSNSAQRWLVRTRPTKTAPGKQGWVPPSYLEKKTLSSTLKSIQDILEMEVESKMDVKEKEADRKRAQVVKELVETEEEFSKDMQQIVNTYLKDFDSAKTPKELRDLRDSIFMNFKQICDFHTNVLIKGVQYYASEPLKLGKTFLRLERDFDMHVRYCRDEPQAQEVLAVAPAKEFFEEYSKRIGEVDKSLRDHLKLPIQRINDYQLLLKELIKYSARLKEDCTDLQKALDLMLSIPQRAHDLKFINSIQGYRGNLFSLGRVLRHDWFTVTDSEGKSKERYLFLFKSRVLVTKVRKISEEKSVFILKDIIRLPDVEVRESPTDKCKIELHHKQKGFPRYPLSLVAKTEFIREAWVKELRDHLAELAGVIDLGIDEIEVEPEKSKAETADESETYEELNTVMTESLRSGSMTSTEDLISMSLSEDESISLTAKKDKKPSPPRFTKPLRPPKALKPGDNLTLECEVTALPPATVSWLKNNMPLSESDRFKFVTKGNAHCLTIKGFQITDEGLYTAKASNASGSAANSAVVCLEVPKEDERPTTPGGTPIPQKPTFPIKLKDTELLEGTSVTFMIKVRAYPEAEVKFFKDGKELKQDDRIKIVAEDKETFELIITHVKKEDTGVFSCKAKNSQGEATSEAKLKVSDEKKLFEGLEEAKKKGVIKPGEEPDFKWFRDGQEFEASERFKVMFKDEEDTVALVFQHVKPEDAGLYTCVASTSSGKISCSAELTVQGAVNQLAKEPEAPKFVTELQDTEASAGGSAMLELKVAGFPKPNITWQKDGQEVKAGGRLRFLHEDEESIALVIKQVTKEDSGKYKVVAKNELGQVTTTANLVVKAPPAFKKQLTDISAMMSEDIRIQVEIEGNPTPEVTWYKDGQQVVQSDRIKVVQEKGEIFALVIKKAVGEDAGSYNCVATNASGKSSEFANLTVNVPAGFVKELKTTEIKETETVKLEAKVVGSPIPKAKWLKDGQELKADGKHIKIEQDERNHSVTIDKAVRQDAGKFTIEVTNEFGKSSSSGDLIINSIPEFSAKLGDVTIKEGDQDVKFEVKLSGTPTPKIKWFIESMEINEKSNNFKVINDGETQALVIKSVEESCAGKITCQATNSMGDVKTSAVINVLTKPKFTQSITDKEVTEGDTVKYTITVHSNPAPEVKWYKNNQEVTVDAKVKITKESSETWSLTLDCVSAATAGDYECRAKNSEGETITKSKLIVNKITRTEEESEEIVETVEKIVEKEEKEETEESVEEQKEEKVENEEKVESEEKVEIEEKIEVEKKDEIEETIEKEKQEDKEEKVIVEESIEKVEVKEDVESEVKTVDSVHKEVEETVTTESESQETKSGDKTSERRTEEKEERKETTEETSYSKEEQDVGLDLKRKTSRTKKEEDSDSLTLKIYEAQTESGSIPGSKKIETTVTRTVEKSVYTYVEEEKDGDRQVSSEYEEEKVTTQEVIVEGSDDADSQQNSDTKRKSKDSNRTLTIREISEEESDSTSKNDRDLGNDGKRRQSTQKQTDTTMDESKTVTKHESEEISSKKEAQKQTEKTPEEAKSARKASKHESEEIKSKKESQKQTESSPEEAKTARKASKHESEEVHSKKETQKQTKETKTEEPQTGRKLSKLESEEITSKKEAEKLATEETESSKTAEITEKKEKPPKGSAKCKSLSSAGQSVKEESIKKTGERLEDQTPVDSSASTSTPDSSTPANPTFDKGIQDQDIWLGLEATLDVKVQGIPYPDVKWIKDDKPIAFGDRVKSEKKDNVHTLRITQTKVEDGGNYKCEIKNKIGESTTQAKLTIKTPADANEPAVTKHLSDVMSVRYSPAVFEARILGNPRPMVNWYKDGKPLQLDERIVTSEVKEDFLYRLTINKCVVEDMGKYKITAENESGTVSTEAELDVKVPPEITISMDRKIMPKGQATFEAKVTGLPQPKVSWWTKGKELISGDVFKWTADDKKQLYVLNVDGADVEDGGEYQCVGENMVGKATQPFNLLITTDLPKFTKTMENILVKPTKPCQFDVEVDGIPMPHVKWFFKGTELKESDKFKFVQHDERNHSLVITPMMESDVGEFTCKAISKAGENSCSAKIGVKHDMPFYPKHVPKEVCAIDGEDFTVEAIVDGSPQPTIKWLKDGKEVLPSDRIKMEYFPDTGVARLTVKGAKTEDIGKYTLVATNATGELSSTGVVKVEVVPKPPSFVEKLKKTDVVQGEPLQLCARVTGHPKPNVRWFKDGKPIKPTDPNFRTAEKPDGCIALIIDEVRPEDAGKYGLQVRNSLGESLSEAEVTVKSAPEAPEFLLKPKHTDVFEGFSIKLDGRVKAFPAPTLKWLKDGKDFTPDGERVLTTYKPEDGTFALIINKCKTDDTGKYSCVATNSLGENTAVVDLGVRGRTKGGEALCAPSFVTSLSDISIDEGGPIRMTATIAGNPIPDIKWTKDGQPIATTDTMNINFDGQRVILDIKKGYPKDAGKYECTLSNVEGSTSSVSNVKVKKLSKAPVFTQRFPDVNAVLGQDVQFVCRAVGLPNPEAFWYFNDKELHDSDRYRTKHEADMFALFIKNCQLPDIGNVTCKIKNSDGEDKCVAFLNVTDTKEVKPNTEAPSFLKKLADCDVIEGMLAKFTACISGLPEPEFKWYKDGRELVPTNRIKFEVEPHGLIRLLIKPVGKDDMGKYSLKITNSLGSDECSAALNCERVEEKKPKKPMADERIEYEKVKRSGVPYPLPDKPIISKMTDRRLTLSWKPSIPLGPQAPVTYTVDMCKSDPDGDWFAVRRNIRGCCIDIRNLEPFQDYKFRVRVENKYGISDPSPQAIAYRTKLELPMPKYLPAMPPELDFRAETSQYFPKDFDLDKPPHEAYAHPPHFLRQDNDTQYGVKNQPSSLHWYIYGYPMPNVTWIFNEEKIEMHGRYDSSFTRNGQASLYINRFMDRDVGVYECVAVNEHGEARQRVKMEIAEPPEFTSQLEESTILLRDSGTLQCRVIGVPYPEIKWYKDWHPLADSNRIKMEWKEPDLCTLTISDTITKDAGLYSCAARNLAGMASNSVMVTIEDNESNYAILTYSHNRVIKGRHTLFEDSYDLGDELGRGTQSRVYHAVERATGNSYAAKLMTGKGDLHNYMNQELDIMNQLHDRQLIRAVDAFTTKTGMSLITELASGGDLLDSIIKQDTITESEIALYIRQILWGLDHMHGKGIAHLGLTIGDLLVAKPGGDDIKICDFGLARRLVRGNDYFVDYGMPEFVAPEIANKHPVSFQTDMWSVGVITYLLLSGISPFLGDHDRHTLQQVQQGRVNFDPATFSNISDEAKDFMSKLLVFDSSCRLDVKSALKHPWLKWADRLGTGERISTDRLRNYYKKYREWTNNSACRRWYRRRPLASCFTHPSRMVYPPDEEYTPPPSRETSPSRKLGPIPSFKDRIDNERERMEYDLGYVDSESRYQMGPDTYLLQLRDVGLPLRLREYMRVSASACPTMGLRLQDTLMGRSVTIRERRRFHDIMDEEIDEERSGHDNSSQRRITSEVAPRSETKSRIKELLPLKNTEGKPPFFREKLHDKAYAEEKPVELSCVVIGEPKPVVQWYRNDVILAETHRLQFIESDGRNILKFSPAKAFDAGVYKAIARNLTGEAICRARLRLGDVPGRPDAPEVSSVSDTEALIKYQKPKDKGNSTIACYEVEFKEPEATEWTKVCNNITHDFFLIRNLKPRTLYHFRVRALNEFGWGDFSVPSESKKTGDEGSQKVSISKAMKHQQELTEGGFQVETSSRRPSLDYSVEDSPVSLKEGVSPTDTYNFISEIARGQFSVVVKCSQKDNEKTFTAKLVDAAGENETKAKREYDIIKSLRHERIACLKDAFHHNNLYALVTEKLQGYDILTFLTHRHEYSEEMVTKIVSQTLDALQYLHFRGIVHLDIQPDNIVMKCLQRVEVKLVDFGSAVRLPPSATTVIDTQPNLLEYRAPEVIAKEDISAQADVWSLGVLIYVLLSGVSPFLGNDEKDTKENISLVRYRFEHLYKEITMESTRFLMQLFKRTPGKRPTVDECLEHKWLNPSELMLRKRERAVFLSNRLKQYADDYHRKRQDLATKSEALLSAFGTQFSRSVSVECDTETTF